MKGRGIRGRTISPEPRVDSKRGQIKVGNKKLVWGKGYEKFRRKVGWCWRALRTRKYPSGGTKETRPAEKRLQLTSGELRNETGIGGGGGTQTHVPINTDG